MNPAIDCIHCSRLYRVDFIPSHDLDPSNTVPNTPASGIAMQITRYTYLQIYLKIFSYFHLIINLKSFEDQQYSEAKNKFLLWVFDKSCTVAKRYSIRFQTLQFVWLFYFQAIETLNLFYSACNFHFDCTNFRTITRTIRKY